MCTPALTHTHIQSHPPTHTQMGTGVHIHTQGTKMHKDMYTLTPQSHSQTHRHAHAHTQVMHTQTCTHSHIQNHPQTAIQTDTDVRPQVHPAHEDRTHTHTNVHILTCLEPPHPGRWTPEPSSQMWSPRPGSRRDLPKATQCIPSCPGRGAQGGPPRQGSSVRNPTERG